ncbi:MAG: cation:proton antiporter [Clostridia bacterium]|jgi:CPA2 family monovalent cation:H+ antiporter-2|nr:cation:proton antiporter [Clostridia bacterium]
MGDIYFPVLMVSGGLFILLFFIGFIGMKIRIPGVVLYILLGVALGGVLSGNELLNLTGEIGIVILFFMLGMEFPIRRLIEIAKKVALAGTLDVILNLVLTMGICILFGLDLITSFLIGGVVYATSSSITAKMLESSKRMANPESEFMLALLIFEDIVAPVAVAILVGLTAGTALSGFAFGLIIAKIIFLIIGAVLIGHFVFSKSGNYIDKYLSEDFFIMLVVGMALAYGGLALMLDLSEVLGAFLAGIILAEVRRTEQLEHAILPIRDLLLPLFFLYFGTTIAFGDGVPMIPLLITLLVWSIVAKIIVGYYGGLMYGLSKKVALRAGISFTQRGEFSVIIASLATDAIRLFSGVFILSSAMIGILMFQMASKITNMIFPKKERPHKYKVPGA